jgi:hypothetical protein
LHNGLTPHVASVLPFGVGRFDVAGFWIQPCAFRPSLYTRGNDFPAEASFTGGGSTSYGTKCSHKGTSAIVTVNKTACSKQPSGLNDLAWNNKGSTFGGLLFVGFDYPKG